MAFADGFKGLLLQQHISCLIGIWRLNSIVWLYIHLFPCITFSVLERLSGWEKKAALILKYTSAFNFSKSVLERPSVQLRISIIHCPRCSYMVYTFATIQGGVALVRSLFTNKSKWCLPVCSFYHCNFAPGLCLYVFFCQRALTSFYACFWNCWFN